MKTIEKLGEWVLDDGWILIGLLVLFALASTELYAVAFGPKEVTIDGSHFTCTSTEPVGIEARCIQYTWTKGVK